MPSVDLQTKSRGNFGNMFFILSIIMLSLAVNSLGISVEEELTLTMDQKKTLDLFKAEMMPLLKVSYMKNEAYLIKWLRAANFNLETAKENLKNTLKWRSSNGIDGIMEEDFSYWDQETPCYNDGVDYENRPVVSVEAGKFDVRRFILAGRSEKFLRHEYRCIESVNYLIKDAQAKGLNVTQGDLIMDLKGFSVMKQACLQCIPIYVEYLVAVQHHYVGILNKFFLINVPLSFQPAFDLVRPAMNDRVRNALEVYGTNQKEWKNRIFKFVNGSTIRPQFGGTRSEEFDY